MKRSSIKNLTKSSSFKVALFGLFVFLPALTFYIGFKMHPDKPIVSNVCVPSNRKI